MSAREPVPYESLVGVQVFANRLAVAASTLDDLVEAVDGWVAEQLGLVGDNDELKGDDYSAAVSDEFQRCVNAREAALHTHE